MSDETKVIYHIDDEDTPYLVKLPVGPDKVTLADFKNVLNRPNYKFFFKSMDDDFGVVKEEIIEDECPLPCFNGRVVSWLVSAEGGSVLSDETGSQCGTDTLSSLPPGAERGPGVGETRPPSFHGGPIGGRLDSVDTTNSIAREFDDTESSITSVSQIGQRRHGGGGRMPIHGRAQQLRGPGGANRYGDASSVLSSEIETTSFFDTEDNESMASSRFTTSTEATSVSRQHANRVRKQKRLKHRKPAHLSRASSISSVTDSTLSLNIITVTLNMDTVNFLGISIVGQSNQVEGGDGGIYVGSIMKGGAVALDGRIEPGDMILQVNDINFENMSNDDAVRVLRDVVQKPGPIKLVVAKCWDPNPKDYFTVPRTEPVRPIDPGAWVAHTAAVRGLEIPQPPPSITGYNQLIGGAGMRAPSVTTLTSSSPSLASTVQERQGDNQLTIQSGMKAICGAMQRGDSGLEVRDRMWLKINIPLAFIGSDVVNWLFSHVAGFTERREARKYASQMLKAGFIRHTVNKSTFSEQCYYAFGDIASALQSCNIKDTSDGSETDRDTLGPLPAPGHVQPWSNYPTFSAPPSLGPIYNPAPPPSTYMSFAGPSVLPINQSPRIDFCSSGSSGGGSIRHTLAASGSGSESEVGGNMSNHAANLSISNHPTNHSNLTLSNHPTNMNNFLTEPPTGPPPLPPGGSFMIPQSGM
eukprot:TRINITY_DN9479_c0_g1_i4.p1 TRINITY_DN9479_c0_g1~~TRINITY_DN9479_c0_g1_i4.p1  ORF type:complete len:696 (-),score=222.61 TRINITY_DN9479_c0_g1_i4:632-2719(-)